MNAMLVWMMKMRRVHSILRQLVNHDEQEADVTSMLCVFVLS